MNGLVLLFGDILLITMAALLGLSPYLIAVFLLAEDKWAYFRNMRTRKILKRNKVENVQGLFSNLLGTEPSEWNLKQKDVMAYSPFPSFPHIRFVYKKPPLGVRFSLWLYVSDIEKVKVWNRYEKDDISYINHLDESLSMETFPLKMSVIVEHLQAILEEKQIERHLSEQKKKMLKEDGTQQNEKEMRWIAALSNTDFWEKKEKDEFRLEVEENASHFFIHLYADGIPFISVFLKQDKFRMDFLNEHHETFAMIRKHAVQFQQYLFQHCASLENLSHTLPDIKKRLRQMQEQMSDLLRDRKWLNEEEIHMLEYTWPRDLKNMMKVYDSMRDEKMSKDVIVEAINMIKAELHTYRQAVEQRKAKEVDFQKEIIAKRRKINA